MENVDIEQLPLWDLHGKTIEIGGCFQNYVLLIFLRHLA
jgi:hypothetical protein